MSESARLAHDGCPTSFISGLEALPSLAPLRLKSTVGGLAPLFGVGGPDSLAHGTLPETGSIMNEDRLKEAQTPAGMTLAAGGLPTPVRLATYFCKGDPIAAAVLEAHESTLTPRTAMPTKITPTVAAPGVRCPEEAMRARIVSCWGRFKAALEEVIDCGSRVLLPAPLLWLPPHFGETLRHWLWAAINSGVVTKFSDVFVPGYVVNVITTLSQLPSSLAFLSDLLGSERVTAIIDVLLPRPTRFIIDVVVNPDVLLPTAVFISRQ